MYGSEKIDIWVGISQHAVCSVKNLWEDSIILFFIIFCNEFKKFCHSDTPFSSTMARCRQFFSPDKYLLTSDRHRLHLFFSHTHITNTQNFFTYKILRHEWDKTCMWYSTLMTNSPFLLPLLHHTFWPTTARRRQLFVVGQKSADVWLSLVHVMLSDSPFLLIISPTTDRRRQFFVSGQKSADVWPS